MEKKKIEAQTVLAFSLKATLKTITTAPGNAPEEIIQKAETLGLKITGPQIWQYRNCDGKPETIFDLDICLPVKEAKGDAGKFHFDTLPEVVCISEIHKGAWSNLTNTYNRILGEISRKEIVPTNISREVYLVCDLEKPDNCLTEVQWIIEK